MLKKYGKYAVSIYASYVLIFNAIAFLLPTTKTATFWIGYGFTMLAYAMQLGVYYFTYGKVKTTKEAYFATTVANYAFSHMNTQVLFGIICIFFSQIPVKYALFGSILIFALGLLAVSKAMLGTKIVSDIDTKVKIKTYYMRSLIIDLQKLLAEAEGYETYEEVRKVLETVKYSDPMNNEALVHLEEKISDQYEELVIAVEKNNVVKVRELCREINILFVERNNKLKLLK